VKEPWVWLIGLVVVIAASPILVCLLRALVPAVVVVAVAVIAVRLSFHCTRERW
jgi:hypothetical protein